MVWGNEHPVELPAPAVEVGVKSMPKDCIKAAKKNILCFGTLPTAIAAVSSGRPLQPYPRGGHCSRARPPLTRRCGGGRIAHRRGAHCSTGRTSRTSTLWQQGCPSMPGSRTQFPERDGRRSPRPRQPPALPHAASTAQASARGAALAPLGCAHHCCWRAPAASKPKPEFLSPPHPTMKENKK